MHNQTITLFVFGLQYFCIVQSLSRKGSSAAVRSFAQEYNSLTISFLLFKTRRGSFRKKLLVLIDTALYPEKPCGFNSISPNFFQTPPTLLATAPGYRKSHCLIGWFRSHWYHKIPRPILVVRLTVAPHPKYSTRDQTSNLPFL